MHKRKDGKIIASLTEVKNKTGDIFALVDEFGEVLLTSYNKDKYRIVKIGVGELLQEKKEKVKEEPKVEKVTMVEEEIVVAPTTTIETVEEKEPEMPKAEVTPEPKVEVSEPVVETPAVEEEQNSLISAQLVTSLSTMTSWNRNSQKEMDFIANAKRALQ